MGTYYYFSGQPLEKQVELFIGVGIDHPTDGFGGSYSDGVFLDIPHKDQAGLLVMGLDKEYAGSEFAQVAKVAPSETRSIIGVNECVVNAINHSKAHAFYVGLGQSGIIGVYTPNIFLDDELKFIDSVTELILKQQKLSKKSHLN